MTGIVRPDCLMPKFPATSKKQVLQTLGDKLAELEGLSPYDVFHGLMDRERLGSTGVGGGVAIPHCKVRGLAHMTGLVATLQTPINFDSPDGTPVDIVFMLLAPDESGTAHLQTLARVARFLRKEDHLRALRAGHDLSACLDDLLRQSDKAA